MFKRLTIENDERFLAKALINNENVDSETVAEITGKPVLPRRSLDTYLYYYTKVKINLLQ